MLRIVPRALALLLVASATLYAQTSRPAAGGARYRLALDKGWTFREAGKGEWMKASVPGSVHTDLLANGRIEDPFYRDNERQLQWIGKTDWEYRTTFEVSPALMRRQYFELGFEGLDTYADVFLNDRQVLSADNMFRAWTIGVTNAVRPGVNTLRVRFRSPINEVLPVMKALGYELPAANDQGEKTSPHTRKAPYHYGWDWGPRFVTSGIWRPAWLEAFDVARLSDLHVVQNRLGRDSAQLTANVEVHFAEGGGGRRRRRRPFGRTRRGAPRGQTGAGREPLRAQAQRPRPATLVARGDGRAEALHAARAAPHRRAGRRRTRDALRPAHD